MMGETEKRIVEAPCCWSERECRVRIKYVVSLEDEKILRTIPAVRCYRGVKKGYIVSVTGPIAIIEYYMSNRGVHYINIEYSNWERKKTLEVVRRVLGLESVEKIIMN